MKPMPNDYDDISQEIERRSIASRERVRAMVLEAGRPDVLADFDRNMKEIDNGVMGAKNAWHSISDAQRRTLLVLSDGYELRSSRYNRNAYEGYCLAGKRDALGLVCRIRTVRALCAHELAHVNGGALDPEKSIIITERGAFVVKHGRKDTP